MIGYLRGKILDSKPERVLLDVGGVGYQLLIPLSTYSEIDRSDHAESIGLYVHTHVRAEALDLFGFWTERERTLFESLISISGVGPKLAQVILSGMASEELVRAIAAEDAARLATIPGIGKKTAQRMVVELKDKMASFADELPARTHPTKQDDLLTALINLGYREGEASKAVARAREEFPDGDFQTLLRASLRPLAKG